MAADGPADRLPKPGQLNINTEKIYELGNYQSVGLIRDIPDLTFDLESLDVSAELECILTGRDFTATPDGTLIAMANILPLDVASQFKGGRTATNPFDVVASVAVPYLVAESISYRFGLRDNASQSVSLRGDAIFYATASAYVQSAVGTNAANQAVLLTNTALPYNGDTINGVRYTLGVSLRSGKRLAFGTDYTEAAVGGTAPLAAPVQSAASTATTGGTLAAATYFYRIVAINALGTSLGSNEVSITTTGATSTVTTNWATVTGATGYRVYRGTAAGAQDRLVTTTGLVLTFVDTGAATTAGTVPTQNTSGTPEKTVTITVLAAVPVADSIRVIYQSPVVAVYPQVSHAVASATRPAAIRDRDIEVRVGGALITDRWSSIQSINVEQRVTLEKDEEFGNAQAVGQDFDVPEVSGSIEIKPRDVAELMRRLRQIAGIATSTEVIGAWATVVLPVLIILRSPDTGAIVQRVHARQRSPRRGLVRA